MAPASTASRQADAVWLCLIAAGTLYEVQALARKRDDDTISRRTRHWAHVHHPIGRAAFLTGWAVFSVWYAQHIVRGQ